MLSDLMQVDCALPGILYFAMGAQLIVDCIITVLVANNSDSWPIAVYVVTGLSATAAG